MAPESHLYLTTKKKTNFKTLNCRSFFIENRFTRYEMRLFWVKVSLKAINEKNIVGLVVGSWFIS